MSNARTQRPSPTGDCSGESRKSKLRNPPILAPKLTNPFVQCTIIPFFPLKNPSPQVHFYHLPLIPSQMAAYLCRLTALPSQQFLNRPKPYTLMYRLVNPNVVDLRRGGWPHAFSLAGTQRPRSIYLAPDRHGLVKLKAGATANYT
jgi:hypothetical protein